MFKGKKYYNFNGERNSNHNSKTRYNNIDRSSYEEHKEDALAPRADEGRDKLRKAVGSRK